METSHVVNEDYHGHEKRKWIMDQVNRSQKNMNMGLFLAFIGIASMLVTFGGIIIFLAGAAYTYGCSKEVKKWKQAYNRHMRFPYFPNVGFGNEHNKGSRGPKRRGGRRRHGRYRHRRR